MLFVFVVGASLLGLCLGQDVCTVEEFVTRLSKLQCKQTDPDLVLDVFTECGRDDLGEEVVNNCRTNEKNVTCNELTLLIPFRNPIEIRSCYRDDTYDERILSCTAECKEDLETYVNDVLGCCSRSIFEDELNMEYTSIALVSDLIDQCNVSLMGLEPCTTPSTLSFTPSGATEPSCTRDEVFRRLFAIPCNPDHLEPRVKLSKSCGFPANEEPDLACEEGDDGVICVSYAADRTAISILDQVEQTCIKGANDCTEACRSAVLSFRENLGCCVNNIYNNSLNMVYAASYELWSLCGVETVEVCGSESATASAVDIIAKLPFAVASLVLAFLF